MKSINKDPWKELIDKNREEYDNRAPRDLWAAIEKEMEPEQKKVIKIKWYTYPYRVAAVFFALLSIGYFLMYQHFSSKRMLTMETKNYSQRALEGEHYSNELLEVEHYYTVQIKERLNELTTLTDDPEIMKEMDLLKEEFDDLRKEMGDHINDKKLIEAMIQNYRLRLTLLKEILEELKNENSLPKEKGYDKTTI